ETQYNPEEFTESKAQKELKRKAVIERRSAILMILSYILGAGAIVTALIILFKFLFTQKRYRTIYLLTNSYLLKKFLYF
ncbi:MAG TPA: hypothetical protein PKI46_02785, partial [Bacteroidales bacterium]|nr:hypothetical protein [Bacteroidales bacterium]